MSRFRQLSVAALTTASLLLAGCGAHHTPTAAPKAHPRPATPTMTYPAHVTNAIGYIEQYDQAVETQFLRSIAKWNPGLPVSGPNAGNMSAAWLDSPAILKMYGGPKLPPTLQAAGINPAQFPPNGSFSGVQAFAQAEWPYAAKYFPGMTEAQLVQGIEAAGPFLMDEYGNAGVQDIGYTLGPWVPQGTWPPKGNERTLAQDYASTLKGAYITGPHQGSPRIGYVYQTWFTIPASVTNQINATNWYAFLAPVPWKNTPQAGMPPGIHVRWAFELFRAVTVYTVGANQVHNGYQIGEASNGVDDIGLAYVQQGSQGRWFVTHFGTKQPVITDKVFNTVP